MVSLGATLRQLTPTDKTITAVGGTPLTCHGWLSVQFTFCELTNRQVLFICNHVSNIFLSREGCVDLRILPATFPKPMISSSNSTPPAIKAVQTAPKLPLPKTQHPLQPSSHSILPPKSAKLPCHLTEENVHKLKAYLLQKFGPTAFNNKRSRPFPAVTSPPAHIHLKPDAAPYCCPNPIPVPHHWKGPVKQLIDDQISQDILGKLPTGIGTPAIWCHQLILYSA